MILAIIVIIILVGLGLYIFDRLPIDPTVKQIGKAVIIVLAVIWLLYQLWPLAAHLTR